LLLNKKDIDKMKAIKVLLFFTLILFSGLVSAQKNLGIGCNCCNCCEDSTRKQPTVRYEMVEIDHWKNTGRFVMGVFSGYGFANSQLVFNRDGNREVQASPYLQIRMMDMEGWTKSNTVFGFGMDLRAYEGKKISGVKSGLFVKPELGINFNFRVGQNLFMGRFLRVYAFGAYSLDVNALTFTSSMPSLWRYPVYEYAKSVPFDSLAGELLTGQRRELTLSQTTHSYQGALSFDWRVKSFAFGLTTGFSQMLFSNRSEWRNRNSRNRNDDNFSYVVHVPVEMRSENLFMTLSVRWIMPKTRSVVSIP
jgi:hypothetical protein